MRGSAWGFDLLARTLKSEGLRLLGRLNRPGESGRRHGGRWRWRGAWWAAWCFARGPGARGEWRRGQTDVQVSTAVFLGPDGCGRTVDEVY